ncbi:XdhC family protein [Streptomyces sp. 5-8]|uniref:XdhC family protein n=1 Tax=Streptomyces musisoli TaxID=2802280 RepID=A0ABS1P975_9ACTN|nr:MULTISPECIES: XdhC/CoxI family protein [Streptomyces]MBL1108883.1 XdhC family protein [Streptomyces musisoli]MBY8843011.1 XdhC family protein [Streptomyces sp. SP2-10]
MLDLAEELDRWTEEGREYAVATVVAVGGSAPRGPGAALAVDSAGTVIGSVSGGCVEGAVYDLCLQALETGESVTERFGYSDDDAFAVGLTCGGTIDMLITPVGGQAPARRVLASALSAAVRREPTALARIVRGPAGLLGRALLVRPDGAYEGGVGGGPDLDAAVAAEARALLETGRTGTVELSADGSRCPGGLTVLVESNVPPPRMIVFGAVDFASALARAGRFLGYHVTVCDARPVFATRARFPDADEVVVDWPHRYLRRTGTDARTVLCVLTHDAKFDVPLLKAALRLPVAFVGAMGSRRTHEDRNRRLRAEGVTERELTRLRSPIGLDLGARTPEETALSIAAEIVAVRRGGTGVPLTGSRTPIHRDEAEHGGDRPRPRRDRPGAGRTAPGAARGRADSAAVPRIRHPG